jgi:uncharacterized protein
LPDRTAPVPPAPDSTGSGNQAPAGGMGGYGFRFHDLHLLARPSGALWCAEIGLLAVSDLHLGKSERLARRGGSLLPPYEAQDTLLRLEAEIDALAPAHVVCLGDTFDDAAAVALLDANVRGWLQHLMAGRVWTWIEGNHDPGPVEIGGSHRAELWLGAVRLCHQPGLGAGPEVAGHFHPKLRLAGRAHRCFVIAPDRVILPAFGAYTGGMWCDAPPLAALIGAGSLAVLTGRRAIAVPL